MARVQLRLRNDLGQFRLTPARLTRRVAALTRGLVLGAYLSAKTRWRRERVVSRASDVVVALTTYGSRLDSVHIAIESIAAGHDLPARLILVVDDQDLARARDNPQLRRLVARGLEITPAEADFAGHKKYYPLVERAEWGQRGLVIADDDIIYPRYWLESIVRQSRAHPGSVVSQWTKTYGFWRPDKFLPYVQWSDSYGPENAGIAYFMGGSGTLIPPALCEALRMRGRTFMECCRTADDIWLNWVSVAEGIKVVQVGRTRMKLQLVPRTQGEMLAIGNVVHGGNDVILASLYSDRQRRDIFVAQQTPGGLS